MSQEYDNKNTFVLFKNKNKDTDKHPEYTGKLTDENGKEWSIAVWMKESKKDGSKFMSGKISEFQQRSNGSSSDGPSASDNQEQEDDLPF